MRLRILKSAILGGASVLAFSTGAWADRFDIPGGDLATALDAYSAQTGIELLYSAGAIKGRHSAGARGELTSEAALRRILAGTGYTARRTRSGAIGVIHEEPKHIRSQEDTHIAEAAPAHAASSVETVVVTSSKIKGDIQTVPIAITALSQEQLTSRQIAGGPDLVKEVPNLTFTKTNFTGYSIQIRGIGTQAISVTTDPAVAVALNDIPFIRNHFFEQEFYDVGQVEVVRGPQGTLYGRNATAGVVNVISAKPTDQFEAMLSADWGNYANRRYEGMVNLPIVDDRLDLRVAGEWTKRDGYTKNGITGDQVDGRDLWSTRVTLGWKPSAKLQTYLVWEHFQESDDRMRTSKQLCHTDTGPTSVLGVPVYDQEYMHKHASVDPLNSAFGVFSGNVSQGCLPDSLYNKGDPAQGDYGSFGVPYGFSLPYVQAGWISGAMNVIDPYASTTQSTNLRVIETQINPRYIAKNDTVEFNADYNITPTLTFSSQTGWNEDFLWSTEDYNRFNTSEGIFHPITGFGSNVRDQTLVLPDGHYVCSTTDNYVDSAAACSGQGFADPTGYFCDPQLGCSSRLVAQDISDEHAWQLSQEFRLASSFKGPFNFSIGGNYMHYETVEDYYVFANALTLFAASSGGGARSTPWVPGVTTDLNCFQEDNTIYNPRGKTYGIDSGVPTESCYYIDPNPLGSVNSLGHNYFMSRNPYVLNSYAGFGEAYYTVMPDLKLTGGLRWTDDQKHFLDMPSQLLTDNYGYITVGAVDQQWNQWTGRFAADWTPKLDFTNQTLVYGSFAHGYKAGGANPPGAVLTNYFSGAAGHGIPQHPLTFKPEFVDAYELGTKNTLADGGITLNGDVFYYNYSAYQISEIVDRTSINLNFDATVKGAELEASYEPIPGLKFNFAGGYEDTRIKNGQSAIDLMDRTAGHSDWMVVKPFPTQASNCIFPDYVVAALLLESASPGQGNPMSSACGLAYNGDYDPGPNGAYHYNNGDPYYTDFSGAQQAHSYPFTITGHGVFTGYSLTYPGFDPFAGRVDPATGTIADPYVDQNVYNGHDYGPAPNNGEGFSKNVGGNALPNAPHFTASFSAEYTMPVSTDWAASLHGDFYWQSQSWSRVFNDRPYDKIRGYSNVNLALILTSADGWQVMGYLKNVFDTTAITGTFLNSDDSGLTTNIFLTDPRLFGVRVTKNW